MVLGGGGEKKRRVLRKRVMSTAGGNNHRLVASPETGWSLSSRQGNIQRKKSWGRRKTYGGGRGGGSDVPFGRGGCEGC